MAITTIIYRRLIRWLLPVRLRQPKLFAFLIAITEPIRVYNYQRFKKFEEMSWYDLKYQTGQVAYLEYVLNDKFDAVQKRIWIGSGTAPDRIYIYTSAETMPLYIFTSLETNPVYIYTSAEQSQGQMFYDFTVNVPHGLPFADSTIKAVIDRYKRDGKSYDYILF